uniref:ERCC1-like central domain-containing protein n=1 Tax=Malurus cyaneus samueli TaxID=2593467 RepID=A0A8C5X424_9PASS
WNRTRPRSSAPGTDGPAARERRRFTVRQEGPDEPPVPAVADWGRDREGPRGTGDGTGDGTGVRREGAGRTGGPGDDREGEGGGGTSISRGLDPVGSCRDTGPVPVQRGNPVLKFIRNVPWEFGDIVPDYVLGQSSCVTPPNPTIIHGASGCPNVQTLSPVSPSPEEAARYLETFKSYEQKPPDLLKERVEHDFLSRVSGLSSPHKCPLPPRAAKRLFDVLHEPFLKTPR